MDKQDIIDYLININNKLQVKRTRFLLGLKRHLMDMLTVIQPTWKVEPELRILQALNVDIKFISKRTRKREVVLKRQQFHALMKHNSKLNLVKIGKISGGFDHATVLHSEKTINNLLDTDTSFKRNFYEMIEKNNLLYPKQ